MSNSIPVALAASVLGGALVAVINQLSARKRTQAEARKLDAEADLTRAQTAKMLSEIQAQPQQTPAGTVPTGWVLRGSDPDDYEAGTDTATAHSGAKSGFIAARPHPRGFATLMQQFKADRYRATRLRLSAYIKTSEVEQWAGLWMRGDEPSGGMLAFDNMGDRPIRGTTDWRLYHVGLDVVETADSIAFGVLLEGPGRVWLDNFAFEPVSQDVPTTGGEIHTQRAVPVNLNFDL